MDLFYVINNNLSKDVRLKHSEQHVQGRKIIEYAAKNIYNIENYEIEVIKFKPQFKYSKKQFSISHSNNIIIVGFDDNPLGIDIEYMKNRDIISISERMSFNLEETSLEEFYKHWTQYEAKYKLGSDTNYFMSQKFENKYMLSVASKTKIDIVNIKRIEII